MLDAEDDDSLSDYAPSQQLLSELVAHSFDLRRRRRSQAPEPPPDRKGSMSGEGFNDGRSATFNRNQDKGNNLPEFRPSANITDPLTSARASRVSKKILIAYLRTLHDRLAHRHKLIAGFDWHLYRHQPPMALPLAQVLTGIDCRLELMRGEIGSEEYFAYMGQASKLDIMGHIREMEEKVRKMDGRLEGILFERERSGNKTERAF